MKNVVSTYVERWNTLLGAIFVIVIMFMPYGLVPGLHAAVAALAEPREAARAAAPERAAMTPALEVTRLSKRFGGLPATQATCRSR